MSDPTYPSTQNGTGRLPSDLEERDGLLCYRGATPFASLPVPDGPDRADFEWACQDPQVQQQYGGLVIAVANRRVWGAGRDESAAWEEARKQPDCPPEDRLIFVPV